MHRVCVSLKRRRMRMPCVVRTGDATGPTHEASTTLTQQMQQHTLRLARAVGPRRCAAPVSAVGRLSRVWLLEVSSRARRSSRPPRTGLSRVLKETFSQNRRKTNSNRGYIAVPTATRTRPRRAPRPPLARDKRRPLSTASPDSASEDPAKRDRQIPRENDERMQRSAPGRAGRAAVPLPARVPPRGPGRPLPATRGSQRQRSALTSQRCPESTATRAPQTTVHRVHKQLQISLLLILHCSGRTPNQLTSGRTCTGPTGRAAYCTVARTCDLVR